jgi:hypothetical protein
LLEAVGFSVRKIPRTQGRTADFHVRDARHHSYLVEVTEKQPAENFREFLNRAKLEGIATLSRTVASDDRIDGVIRDKADQLRRTRSPSDFRVLWLTASDDDAKHLCEVLFRTLYGVADLSAIRKLSSVTEQPRFLTCFYYNYFSFYRHCDLHGVAFSSVNKVCLFLNPMSQRVDDFRSSDLCNQFALRNGLVDPDALASRPDVLFMDLEVNRADDKAKWSALRSKYGLFTSCLRSSSFEGRLVVSLPSNGGEAT